MPTAPWHAWRRLLAILVTTRHRGDSNPCGQSPMDFESISLAARTQCHVSGESFDATLPHARALVSTRDLLTAPEDATPKIHLPVGTRFICQLEICSPRQRMRRQRPSSTSLCKQDSLAEWSKALASGASPQGRGFEPTAVSACQRSCVAMYPTTKLFQCVCRNVEKVACHHDNPGTYFVPCRPKTSLYLNECSLKNKMVVLVTAYNSIVAVTLDICMS